MSQKKKSNLPVIIRKKNNNQVVKRNPTNYPVYSQPQVIQPTKVFRGNIVNGMKFGNPGDMLSGFVQREIIYIDRNGNKQIAKEKQFFNSGKHIVVEIEKRKKDLIFLGNQVFFCFMPAFRNPPAGRVRTGRDRGDRRPSSRKIRIPRRRFRRFPPAGSWHGPPSAA